MQLELGKKYRTGTHPYAVVEVVGYNPKSMYPYLGDNGVAYFADGRCRYDGQEIVPSTSDLVQEHN